MIDVIIIAAVVLIAFGAGYYIYREKKKGKKCIGCPYSTSCNGKCGGSEKTSK